jgi:hypothetical protein
MNWSTMESQEGDLEIMTEGAVKKSSSDKEQDENMEIYHIEINILYLIELHA